MSALLKYAEEIRYVSTGTETVEEVTRSMPFTTADFDPEKDVLIPVGRSVICLVVGAGIAHGFPDKDITIGIFINKSRANSYEFITLEGAKA
jgi:hypothetical protein